MTYVKGVYYPRRRKPPAERFWPKVDKSGDCWLWTGGTTYLGYGEFYMPGLKAPARAHRVAWELTFGPIPDGAVIMHTCDNPPCVKPAHLEVGSLTDNARDMSRKGRGRGQFPRKLTEDDIPLIRAARANGETYQSISQRFGVYWVTIRNVVQRKSWRHIP